MEVHFPGSQAELKPSPRQEVITRVGEATFITVNKVREAIGSFGDFKSPGRDELPPIVLKHLGPKALAYLVHLFQISLTIGHVPDCWRHSRVIFIPKAGRKSYSEARSFRPITLSNFVIKVMERLVLWEINATSLLETPLSTNQHAFRQGRSTDTALSSMVGRIEEALKGTNLLLESFWTSRELLTMLSLMPSCRACMTKVLTRK